MTEIGRRTLVDAKVGLGAFVEAECAQHQVGSVWVMEEPYRLAGAPPMPGAVVLPPWRPREHMAEWRGITGFLRGRRRGVPQLVSHSRRRQAVKRP